MSLLIRPNDPLAKAGSEQQRALFLAMAKVSAGHSIEEVIGAAMNVMVNALRQSYPRRDKAMEAVDYRAAKLKELLAACYTSTGGRVNGAFPFNQTIEIPHMKFGDTIRG